MSGITIHWISKFLYPVTPHFFFPKDRYREIEKEIEELSMNVLQENYQLKKRLRVLEEELMMDGDAPVKKRTSVRNPIHEVVRIKCWLFTSKVFQSIRLRNSLPFQSQRSSSSFQKCDRVTLIDPIKMQKAVRDGQLFFLHSIHSGRSDGLLQGRIHLQLCSLNDRQLFQGNGI